MSQTTYNSEKVAKKKVRYSNDTGSPVTIRGGYAVCYDYSLATIAQAYTVKKPATDNLLWFAGIVTEEYDGKVVANGETLQIEIYIPTKYGQVVPVWITEDHSANIALLEITDGSFALTEGISRKVAKSVQLVNRNTTNGTCLAHLYGLSDPLA